MLPLSNTLGLVAFVVLAGAFGSFAYVMIRRDQRAKADLRAFAAERGLHWNDHPQTSHDAARFVLRNDTSGLRITITRPFARKSGSGTVTKGGSTVLSLPDPRFDGGLAIYSERAVAGVAAAASGMLGMFDNALSQRMLSQVLGPEIGDHLGQLQAFEPADGSAVTIMASADPRAGFDTAAIAQALQALPHAKTGMGPMVMIGSDGIKLRLGRDLRDPARLAVLLDTALSLQTRLRERP